MPDPIPVDTEIEQLLLGSVLLSSGASMDGMRSTLERQDFGVERHQRIWDAACSLYDSGGALDHVTLHRELDRRGQAAHDELSYLIGLQDGLPQLPCLDRYVEAVKDKALLRRIATIAASLEKRALSGVETGEQLRESLGKLTADLVEAAPSERRPVSTAEMITQVGIDELLRPKRVEGVRLPWGRLDTKLRGLRGGQNVVLAADTGRGKTSMALQIAAHATRQGKAVLYWTLEMPPAALFRRMVTQMSGVDVRNASPTFEQREKERAAVAWLHDSPVYFDRHSRTVAGFCSSVRQIRQKTCLGLVVVDYLQLIRASGRSESRTREVGENSRSLKLATMDFDLPFLVLSQFRRPNGESQPTIHSLKESGDVENDADVILLLNCGELSAEAPTQVAVHVGKQREGPAGFDVPLVFHPRLQSFHSPEEARTCNVPGDTQ